MTTSTTSRSVRWRPRSSNGAVDAIYTQSKPFQHLQEATGKFKSIEDLSRYPDWTLQVANIPAVITCTAEMADEHPELVVTFMKGMIKVGRWANEHKHAAAAILDKQTFYLDVEDTYQGIKHIDMVPNLSPQNLASIEIGKDFMFSHGYIKQRLRRARVGRAGVLRAGGTRAPRRGVEEAAIGEAARGHRARRAQHPARMNEENIMTTTAMDLVKERCVTARTGAHRRPRPMNGLPGTRSSSTCARPRNGSTATSKARSPRPVGCSSSSPTRPAPATRRNSTRPARVIMVCASGARASLAGMTMKSMGYQDVAVLAGGLKGWTEAGLPTCEHDYSGI